MSGNLKSCFVTVVSLHETHPGLSRIPGVSLEPSFYIQCISKYIQIYPRRLPGPRAALGSGRPGAFGPRRAGGPGMFGYILTRTGYELDIFYRAATLSAILWNIVSFLPRTLLELWCCRVSMFWWARSIRSIGSIVHTENTPPVK